MAEQKLSAIITLAIPKKDVFSGVISMKFSNTVKSVLPAAVLGCLTLGLASTPAAAASGPATANFNVNVTVLTTCSVKAADLTFGSYVGDKLDVTSAGITVTCSNGTPYNVGLDLGKNSGSGNTRYMLNTTDNKTTLGYALYSNAGDSTPWNNASGSTVAGVGTGSAQAALPVYGEIPAGEAVVAGSYADIIGVTVTY
jgi:spore coat protein U-like protein